MPYGLCGVHAQRGRSGVVGRESVVQEDLRLLASRAVRDKHLLYEVVSGGGVPAGGLLSSWPQR